MSDLVETNNRLKIRIKQLEATINLCEIKIKESEQNLCKKSSQVVGRESEIIHLKTSQDQLQSELKKLQLQNKIMNNELNQTLIKSPGALQKPPTVENFEESLNRFISFDKDAKFRQEKQFSRQELVRKINVVASK